MTSLLAQVRNDSDVVKARVHVAVRTSQKDFDAYDTALIRAAVRELARRARVEAAKQPYGIEVKWYGAADFIERQGDE